MVSVAGQEDVVAYELAALQSDQGVPLVVVGQGRPHHRGLTQFYRCALG
jgi:hypothetical protein